jgi:hypothetical protein
MRESVVGPSRHFAAVQQFGCFRREADITRAIRAESTKGVERAKANESTKTRGGLDELTLRLAFAVDVGPIRDVRSEIIELIT